MQFMRVGVVLALVFASALVGAAQNPPAGTAPVAQPGNASPGAPGAQPGGRGGRGGGRGGVSVMTLATAAWTDGGMIPEKHSQVGAELSPALTWSNAPDTTQSFVLIVHDIDQATGNGTDDVLHWMLWNIPGTARNLPEGVPAAPQLPDGTRQISGTGPYYRGPGAPASGPPHHYVFELYALDAMLNNVQAVGQSPAQTRAAVMEAIRDHVRGKAAYVGLFKRQP